MGVWPPNLSDAKLFSTDWIKGSTRGQSSGCNLKSASSALEALRTCLHTDSTVPFALGVYAGEKRCVTCSSEASFAMIFILKMRPLVRHPNKRDSKSRKPLHQSPHSRLGVSPFACDQPNVGCGVIFQDKALHLPRIETVPCTYSQSVRSHQLDRSAVSPTLVSAPNRLKR
jgi:hypothetical protein